MNESQQDSPKKLLIIGNGFDLTLGMNSSFSDFLGVNNGTYHMLNDSVNQLRQDGLRFNKGFKDHKIKYSKVLNYINYLFSKRLSIQFTENPREIKSIKNNDKHCSKELDDAMNAFYTKYSKENLFIKDDKFNFWALYFILRKDEGYKNWFSVENEIQDFLLKRNSDLPQIISKMCFYLNINKPNFNSSR